MPRGRIGMTKLSLKWENGRFSVELCTQDRRTLDKARQIGQALDHMQQPTGAVLIEAINAITDPVPTDPPEKPF